jgi:translation elongation factor EF-Ts
MEFIPGEIGIKITNTASMAKCVQILRKYTSASMSEIISTIKSNNYVLTCKYTSDSGIRKIRKCYDQLTKAGITAEIYEHDELTTREFISNLIDTYREIEEETQAMIDAEVGDEEDDEE